VIAPGGTAHDFENRTAERAGALNLSVRRAASAQAIEPFTNVWRDACMAAIDDRNDTLHPPVRSRTRASLYRFASPRIRSAPNASKHLLIASCSRD